MKAESKAGNVQDLAKSINSQLGKSSECWLLIIFTMYYVQCRAWFVTSVRKKLRAKVTFEYVAQNEDELSLKVGDVIEIESQVNNHETCTVAHYVLFSHCFKLWGVLQEEEGWWEGTLNGKRGVFPTNFVDLLDDKAKMSVPGSHRQVLSLQVVRKRCKTRSRLVCRRKGRR